MTSHRAAKAALCLTLIFSLTGCFGPGMEDSTNSEPSTVLEPSPSNSPLFEKYSYTFLGLCEAPDSLNEIVSDSKLIDLGLLAPSDIELAMRELGISLRNTAEWAQRDELEYGPIPDPELISDLNAKGEEILKLRLALLRGEKISISEQVLEIDALFARGKKICDWRDENS